MTFDMKALALRALTNEFSLNLRQDGSWYVRLPGVEVIEVGRLGMLLSPNQSERSPEAAINAAWEDYAVKPYRVVINAYSPSRREVKWNGYMWEDCTPIKDGAR